MIHILIALYAFWDERRRVINDCIHIDPETNNIIWTGRVDGKITMLDLHKILKDKRKK